MKVKVFEKIFFQEQGFFILSDVFTHQQCEELVTAAHEFSSYKSGALTPVMNPHRLDGRFYGAMRHPKILEIMEELLSGTVSGLQSQFFFCRPGTPGFSKHQDNFYVQAKPQCFASAWVALDDVTPQNGGLYVFPGSHREDILPTESVVPNSIYGQDANANCRQTLLPSHYVEESLVVPRGGVVLIHGHVVHASHDNLSQNYRHSLLLTYIKKGETFRKGFSAQREEVDLYSVAPLPIQKQG